MKPVLFELEEAKRLVKHYDFLKKHKYSIAGEQYQINHVLIAPNDPNRLSTFLEWYFKLNDNMAALLQSGFNAKRLQIILLDDYDSGSIVIYEELDIYLTQNRIAKVYDVDLRLE